MELPALTHPDRLWWLLLLPLLWFLALPPRPRRVVLTAHLPQWLAAMLRQRRRPPRFRRWRFLLLVLATIAAVLAHAGLQARALPGKTRLVAVLDASASMAAATADQPSAFSRAVQLLRRRLADVPEDVDVRVVRIGAQLTLATGAAARAFATPGEPAGAPCLPLQDAVAAASAGDTATWVLTDGQHGLPAADAVTAHGARAGNFAIAAVQVQDHWPLPQLELSVTLASYADVEASGELLVQGPVQAMAPIAVSLQPDQRRSYALSLQRDGTAGELSLQLCLPGDALPADDWFRCPLPALPRPQLMVLAEAGTSPALQAAAEVLAHELGGAVVPAAADTAAGFVLVEGGQVPLPPGQLRAVTFGTRLSTEAGVPWQVQAITDWDRGEPLLLGLDFSDLRVDTAWRGLLPEGQPLLWGSGSDGVPEPLLVLARGERAASLHFAFRLADSNLALLPAFPQLLRRALLAAYGSVALPPVALQPEGESELRGLPPPQDQPLPAFSRAGRSLAPWCLWFGLSCLCLRAWLR